MFDIALTLLAWGAIAAMALVGVGVLLLPVYFWTLYRSGEELAQARADGLID